MDEMPENFRDKIRGGLSQAGEALREPEGLATAALGAFLINPLVGLALGIGQGILARRDRQSALDIAAFEQGMLRDFDEMHQQAIAAVQGQATTETDMLQLEQLTNEFQATRKMAMHPDPAVRMKALEQMAASQSRVGAWLEDLEGRQETLFDANVKVLDDQAVVARGIFEKGLEQSQQLTKLGSDMHQLLSDPNFDVNSPAGRARMVQFLDLTPRELLADPADMNDAFQAAGANFPGFIGAATAYWAGKKKAEEFTFTKEEWRKIGTSMIAAGKLKADRNMQDAEQIGVTLDRAAKGMKHNRPLSYLEQIITGRVQGAAGLDSEPGRYDEATRAAAAERAAAANARDAANPDGASAFVTKVKERASSVLLNTLDPMGIFRGMRGDIEGAESAPLSGVSKALGFRQRRRPTN